MTARTTSKAAAPTETGPRGSSASSPVPVGPRKAGQGSWLTDEGTLDEIERIHI